MHCSKIVSRIFFPGLQRRFASAIGVMVYIYRHPWRFRSFPFRVNSGMICFNQKFLNFNQFNVSKIVFLRLLQLVANWHRWWVIYLLVTICQNRLRRVSSKVCSVVVRGASIGKSCVRRYVSIELQKRNIVR